MYIPLHKVIEKFNIHPNGVIHCGAHFGQEHQEYSDNGIERFVYIEPCKQTFDVLTKKVKDKRAIFINIACGSIETELAMNMSKQNEGQSNSFLKSHLHSVQHPEILFTETEVMKVVPLDSLPITKGQYDMLAMDTEGFEGEVLKGAEETLKYIDLIYTEVNKAATRIGNILIDDLEEYLWQRGFVMIETYWPSPNFTWGDAVFIRKNFI